MALALGACGGNEEANDYVGEVNSVTGSFDRAVTDATAEAPGAASPEEAAGVLERFAAELDSSAAALADASPPEEAAALHAGLTARVERLAAKSSDAAARVASAPPGRAASELQAFLSEVTASGAGINAAIARIDRRLHE